MGFESASGIILNRRIVGEGNLSLTLFLKKLGIIYVSAKGAAGGKVRFGGATEPLVWGLFGIYNSRDNSGNSYENGNRYLKSVDVADDMLVLRGMAMNGHTEALFATMRWIKLLIRFLPPGHTDDNLLANLYWNMKLLCCDLPAEVVEWRFIWRWLKAWGIAPKISDCALGVKSKSELELLNFVSIAKPFELKFFEHKNVFENLKHFFADASRHAEIYLNE